MRQMENLRSSVYEVVLERLNRIFSDFDNVYVSFSGGKDSGVLLNLCIDYIRHLQVHEQYAQFCLSMTSEETDSDFLEEEENQQRLRKVIRILTPRTRHILEECYIRKKKYQEVADELEISVSAVRKHIMKALQAMRDEFAKKE